MKVPYLPSDFADVRHGTQLGATIGVGPVCLAPEKGSAGLCTVGSLTGRNRPEHGGSASTPCRSTAELHASRLHPPGPPLTLSPASPGRQRRGARDERYPHTRESVVVVARLRVQPGRTGGGREPRARALRAGSRGGRRRAAARR